VNSCIFSYLENALKQSAMDARTLATEVMKTLPACDANTDAIWETLEQKLLVILINHIRNIANSTGMYGDFGDIRQILLRNNLDVNSNRNRIGLN